LLEQWDHERNRENGNFPGNTSLQSNKLIWWHCQECSKGKAHSWQTRADNAAGGRLARGHQDALTVLEKKCVNATLWKLSVLKLLLILT